MTMNCYPTWYKVETSFEFAETRCGNLFRSIVDYHLFFEMHVFIKSFMTENAELWNNQSILPEKVWILIFIHFREQVIYFKNLERFFEFAFSIAGTLSEVERIFSMRNQTWSDR